MPKTVLIIEDDEDTRLIYTAALESAGYRVVTARHGAEGVQFARRDHPDLILLDIRMPVLDGWGAARYLKTDPETRSIPICAISAYEAVEEEVQTAEQVDFDCFLMKPVTPDQIVVEVRKQIGPSVSGPTLGTGDPAEIPLLD